jgi:hypothetical protein
MDAKGAPTMSNRTAPELTPEEYADEVLQAFDPEWHGSDDHLAYVTDEVAKYIARTANVNERHVNRASVRALVERRLAAQA